MRIGNLIQTCGLLCGLFAAFGCSSGSSKKKDAAPDVAKQDGPKDMATTPDMNQPQPDMGGADTTPAPDTRPDMVAGDRPDMGAADRRDAAPDTSSGGDTAPADTASAPDLGAADVDSPDLAASADGSSDATTD